MLALAAVCGGTRGDRARRQDDELASASAAGGWNALSVGSDAPPADGVTPPGEIAPPREKTERLSEPWLLTRTSKTAVGLGHHVDRAGQRGCRALGQELRLHGQAVALWHQ